MYRWLALFLFTSSLCVGSDRVLTLPSFDHGGGLFHNFMNVIGFLDHVEREQVVNFAVDFETDGHYYDDEMGPNWWSYYFEPIDHKSRFTRILSCFKRTTKRVNSDRMAEYVRLVEHVMAKDRAHELIARHIHLKPDIQSDIDTFIWENFRDHYIIGVHYRGTDKMTKMNGYATPESRYVSFKEAFEAIDLQLQAKTAKACRIFVATDSEAFLQAIKKRYPTLVVHTNSMRSADGSPLHYNVKTKKARYNYLQGRETIIDCVLLSRCHHLIKTSSNLNLCATFSFSTP